MRKVREILRLKWNLGRTNREIGASVKASTSTVSECVRRAARAGLSWPLDEGLGDEQLTTLLYSSCSRRVTSKDRQVDWSHIHREMQRKGVTLQLLWYEYKSTYSEGLGYSRFCGLYRDWKSQVDVCLRQHYKLGEKLFVDYAGMTVAITDQQTGEVKAAQIFVAALGASNYIFVEATMSQSLPDWIGSHCRAFQFFGGVPNIVVPDNLKSGVTKAHRYEPDLNPTYLDMANHYDVAVMPTRVSSPKDKAKVEQAVQHVERQILARLRNRIFFSVHELNRAIKPLLEALNKALFQKYDGSRLSQFITLEKPTLRPLPAQRYEFAEWKKARLGVDYHVEVIKHYYSAPYTLAKKIVDVRFTNRMIEIFYRGKRVASHRRSSDAGKHTTVKEHMPKKHQAYVHWTPERITNWAKTYGEATGLLAQKILSARKYPELGFRSCMGLIRLEKTYGKNRLNAACQRALDIGAHSYKSVQSILKKNLDQLPPVQHQPEPSQVTECLHDNVRGRDYFR